MREHRGETLSELADGTRVRGAYLAALEQGDRSILPSRPFAIGYVRSYATALGLDGELAVERFKRDWPEASEPLRNPVGVGGETKASRPLLYAMAAVLVVVGHSQSAAAGLAAGRHVSFARLTVLPWGAGVDLFFVISGFIMVYASQRLFGRRGAWREFLRRRLTRIAPVYWLWTTLYLAILLAAHLKGDPRGVTPVAALASYLCLPFATGGHGTGAFPSSTWVGP